MSETPQAEEGFFLRHDIRHRIQKHDATILRWEEQGLFPKRVLLGPNTIGWRRAEVLEWERSRPLAAGRVVKNPGKAKRAKAALADQAAG